MLRQEKVLFIVVVKARINILTIIYHRNTLCMYLRYHINYVQIPKLQHSLFQTMVIG